MKSSSNLFPVALMKADFLANGLHEDIYLLKPNNDADVTVQIAVTRVGRDGAQDRGKPIALMHGAFTNRGLWKAYDDNSLISYLIAEGFDPWLVEMRGHGDSPFNQDYNNNSLERIAGFDLQPVSDFIIEQTAQKPIWLGYSWGGVCLSVAAAKQTIHNDNCDGLILIGAQTGRYPLPLRLPLLRLLAKVSVRLRGKPYSSSMGPEPESPGLAREFVRWASLLSPWRDQKKRSLKILLKESTLPVLAVAGENDRSDPPKYCHRLAMSFGGESKFLKLPAYNHVGLVMGKNLKEDLWPEIKQWIKSSVINEEKP